MTEVPAQNQFGKRFSQKIKKKKKLIFVEIVENLKTLLGWVTMTKYPNTPKHMHLCIALPIPLIPKEKSKI